MPNSAVQPTEDCHSTQFFFQIYLFVSNFPLLPGHFLLLFCVLFLKISLSVILVVVFFFFSCWLSILMTCFLFNWWFLCCTHSLVLIRKAFYREISFSSSLIQGPLLTLRVQLSAGGSSRPCCWLELSRSPAGLTSSLCSRPTSPFRVLIFGSGEGGESTSHLLWKRRCLKWCVCPELGVWLYRGNGRSLLRVRGRPGAQGRCLDFAI